MSVSVALLLPGVGSGTAELMVAVLDKVPIAVGEMGAVTVKVKEPPAGRLTELALISPEPVAGPVPPPAPAPVQVAPMMDAGKVSATVAPVTVLGPALVAVMM